MSHTISNILWINLDRSHDRKEYMGKILENFDIPNIRISAIDGAKENMDKIISSNFETEIVSNNIKACALSHLKAILHASTLNGNYFMICEDDISFRNLKYFGENILSNIINNAPKDFDIITLHKTNMGRYGELYIDWNEQLKKGNHIGSAVCYIVSRKGIDKICKKIKYDGDVFTMLTDDSIVSDVLLYKNNNAYCYKYNVITTLDETSTLHSDHLWFHRLSSYINDMYMIEDLTGNNPNDVKYMLEFHKRTIEEMQKKNIL